jgi:PAS domain-containing protein
MSSDRAIRHLGYDFAPVGCFTVDRSTALRELNLAAASMLGSERDHLLGRTLDSFLAPQSARALHAMLASVSDGAPTEVDALQLLARRGACMPQPIATVNTS